jgi:plastocyanin
MRPPLNAFRFLLPLCALALAWCTLAWPQGAGVQLHVELMEGRGRKTLDHGTVVVWLSPQSNLSGASLEQPAAPGHFRMEQKNKSFTPHLLVVPMGSTVEFPNLDPFFHNVFSQFNGKRFDLGLYETGGTRVVHFDHEGISYIFCNIHSQMAAVIVTLRTPYFATGSRSGSLELNDVPAGDYELHVWAEGADPKALQDLSRRVHVGASQRDLGSIQVYVNGTLASHKNKFGEGYPIPFKVLVTSSRTVFAPRFCAVIRLRNQGGVSTCRRS